MKKYTLKYKELEIPFLNIAQRTQQESFLIMRICQGVVALKCKKFFLQKQKGSGFNLKRKIYSKTYGIPPRKGTVLKVEFSNSSI